MGLLLITKVIYLGLLELIKLRRKLIVYWLVPILILILIPIIIIIMVIL